MIFQILMLQRGYVGQNTASLFVYYLWNSWFWWWPHVFWIKPRTNIYNRNQLLASRLFESSHAMNHKFLLSHVKFRVMRFFFLETKQQTKPTKTYWFYFFLGWTLKYGVRPPRHVLGARNREHHVPRGAIWWDGYIVMLASPFWGIERTSWLDIVCNGYL